MESFRARDDRELAWREVGGGRPLVLFHGFTGSSRDWLGPAAVLAEHGHRVILPDLRGHGASAAPHDPAAYPPDVLADDGLALLDHLGLDDYDLGGYSYGGRVVLRLLARGARPGRAVVAGQGLDAIRRTTSRTGVYHDALTALIDGEPAEPGSPAYWMHQAGGDPVALRHVLGTHVPTTDLDRITTPTLVVVGDEDDGHATAGELAAALPNGRFARVPGNHFTAMTGPELTAAMVEFLAQA
ncbi:alpha/beta hydrolase [Amycolatopsis mediterranei S699]|uniref:Alpha/beta hydrolase n=2 Tax=Amycolatopsis mediterranei TaxID=33910 RepID=A0A0H3D6K5_AMYMU|nr:alpha/beta fold hydrolase [Amycolatopsis mediterranei]ADJ45133.1 alpha/beta hydrolase [Amycolatopsis mediterranei U32]AEK41892.1 alpha/beta hydrolase [Amycolatopsis mediterranei S699]AFO76843.1 alpha/beta hydrolase [Amycolatopsis mediterranei S699]AGT83971.1 alpha/beta hydrolase [Amycolatopsis mediterranei RB]KDO08608.1 alpha/beta hydrolase [Amycolatopsis mediterranei]